MKLKNITINVIILIILIIILSLFLIFKTKKVSRFKDITVPIFDKSLFIAYSTKNYEPVTAIWRKSLQDNNIQHVEHKVDDDSQFTSFGFQTDSWHTFVINKIEHLVKILQKHKLSNIYNYFIFTDCDIQYFNKNKEQWNHLEDFIKNSPKHIFFMREFNSSDVNTGFYIIKNDKYIDTIIEFFNNIIETSKITSKQDAPLGDQSIINAKKDSIEYDYIPNEFMIWGLQIYDKTKSIIHHAINTKTKEEKVDQLNSIYNIINN